MRCNVGKDPCTTVTKYSMTEVPVKEEDIEAVQGAVQSVSFPAWSKVCDQSYPDCSKTWKELIGPIVGFE